MELADGEILNEGGPPVDVDVNFPRTRHARRGVSVYGGVRICGIPRPLTVGSRIGGHVRDLILV